jgi:predicted enzyme related to lactoylglutathione lyase
MHYTELFVAIATPDLESTTQFYGQLLDLSIPVIIPGVYAEVTVSGLRLGFFVPKVAHRNEFLGQPGGSISLCLEVEDLDEAIARLNQIGFPPPGSIFQTSHGREVYAYDPQGNRLILHESAKAEA